MNIIPANDVREYDFVFLQFGLDLAPTGRRDRLQKTFEQFLFRSFTETFAAKMFYDHIHIGFIDGTESHVQCLLVNLRNRYGHVIGLVKIGNDTVGEICICIAVLIHQIVDDVERFELVVGIAFVIVVIIRMIVFVRGFAVLLVFELEFFFVLFCTAPQKLDTFGVFFMKYNYEIRLKAVKLVLEGGLSVREAGCHLGCGRSQVHLWVTLFERHGLAGLKLRHGSYSAEFKLSVLKHMHQNHLSLLETAVHFGIPGPFVIRQWERLYQNQGAEGLRRKPQRRRPAMSKSKTKKVKLKTTPHEELLKELEYLRAENAYLKKLQALVEERIVRESGKEPKPSKD